MLPIARRRSLNIQVTVPERDVRDALLILHGYSCAEYVVQPNSTGCERIFFLPSPVPNGQQC